jgi:hypothetical protein
MLHRPRADDDRGHPGMAVKLTDPPYLNAGVSRPEFTRRAGGLQLRAGSAGQEPDRR